MAPRVIILSGGPNSVHLEGAPRVPDGFFDYCTANKITVLGICYGMQVGGPCDRSMHCMLRLSAATCRCPPLATAPAWGLQDLCQHMAWGSHACYLQCMFTTSEESLALHVCRHFKT